MSLCDRLVPQNLKLISIVLSRFTVNKQSHANFFTVVLNGNLDGCDIIQMLTRIWMTLLLQSYLCHNFIFAPFDPKMCRNVQRIKSL